MPSALVVETGSQSTTANSYITLANYKTYRDDRYGDPHSNSDDSLTRFIFRAMSYFESLPFKGSKASDEQALQFPRSGLMVDGYGINSNEIPVEVLESLYEIVFSYEQGNGIDEPIKKSSLKEKIGDIEVEYKSSSADRTLSPTVTNAIRKLIKSPMRVVRA